MATIDVVLTNAGEKLQNTSDAPELDAERLLLHILGQKEPSWLFAHGDENLSPSQQEKFEQLVAQRSTGKPLAYILGEAEFYGRTYLVNNDVLIPRPETEELIDAALSFLRKQESRKESFVIADIGTGSGVIAITLALELPRPDIEIFATDISEKALDVAKQNTERHNVANKIEFIQGDMLEPLAGRKIDLIVSNPPYLPSEALGKVGWTRDTIGLTFEPVIALDGGPDGQDFIKKIKTAGIPAILEVTGGKIQIIGSVYSGSS